MMNSEKLILQEFKSNIQLIEPIVVKHLSESSNRQQITINLSPLSSQPFYCLPNQPKIKCMSVAKVIELFIQRWENEISYQEEIISLKDKVIQEFNEICNEITDETIIDFIRDARQKVIEVIFQLTEFNKKNKGGNFCKGIMNGFEIDIIEKFNEFATYLLWEPFPTQLPVGLINYIQLIFKEHNPIANKTNIEISTQKIIQFIEDYLKCVEIKTIDFKSSDHLNNFLQKMINERRIFSVSIENLKMCKATIENHRKNISKVVLKIDASIFTNGVIPFAYENLELINFNKKTDFQKITQNFPKLLNDLILDFSHYMEIDDGYLKKIVDFIADIKVKWSLKLNLITSKVSRTTMMLLYEIMKNVNGEKVFLIQKLTLQFEEKQVDTDIKAIASVLKNTQSIKILQLENWWGHLTNEAFEELAISIQHFTNMTYLRLSFVHNSCQITDSGIKYLAAGLKKMDQIVELYLNFNGGKNAITNVGMNELADSLKYTNNLSNLNLYFSDGNNSINDEAMVCFGKSLAKMPAYCSMELNFSNSNNKYPSITMKGYEIIKSARQGQKINFYCKGKYRLLSDQMNHSFSMHEKNKQ